MWVAYVRGPSESPERPWTGSELDRTTRRARLRLRHMQPRVSPHFMRVGTGTGGVAWRSLDCRVLQAYRRSLARAEHEHGQ